MGFKPKKVSFFDFCNVNIRLSGINRTNCVEYRQDNIKEAKKMMMPQNVFIYVLGVVGIFFLIAALLQWLWNMTMPEVFQLKPITYWQAFRLMLIAGLLFGGPMFVK